MKKIEKILKTLNKISQQNISTFGAQYDAFSLFIFLFYLANPLKWHFLGPYSFSIIAILRIIAVILWAMLVCWRIWPKKIKTYLPIFWHFCLWYHLPFRTTFSTLYSSHSPSFNSFGLLGIAALAVLVNEKTFCVLTFLGISLGALVYFSFGGLTISIIKLSTLIYACLMVLSILFIKLIFFRNYHLSIQEKNRAYKTLAGSLAHELRNPIATCRLACENENLKIATKQSKKALNIIEAILLQVKYLEKNHKTKCTKQYVNNIVKKSIKDICFYEDEKEKITIEATDNYAVMADNILLSQVFTNMIKNALWSIKKAGKGYIHIQTYKINNKVYINICDTGIGISIKEQKQIFLPYVSNNKNGVGLGLAFCKFAIEKMGGFIKCESKKDQYTKFTIALNSASETKETSYDITTSTFVSNYNSSS